MRRTAWIIPLVIALLAVSAAGFFLEHHAREEFLSSFNRLNDHYKQALYATGQGDREGAVREHKELLRALDDFERSGASVFSPAYRDDGFRQDVAQAKGISAAATGDIETGDLTNAHRKLEDVRPIISRIIGRNGISPAEAALIGFHDAMEVAVDAASAQDAQAVLAAYADADAKLKAVEEAGTDAAEMRTSLEALRAAARDGDDASLPDLGSKLKRSFQKAYLG